MPKFVACMAVVGALLKLGEELGMRGLRSAGTKRGGFCVTVLLLGGGFGRGGAMSAMEPDGGWKKVC